MNPQVQPLGCEFDPWWIKEYLAYEGEVGNKAGTCILTYSRSVMFNLSEFLKGKTRLEGRIRLVDADLRVTCLGRGCTRPRDVPRMP